MLKVRVNKSVETSKSLEPMGYTSGLGFWCLRNLFDQLDGLFILFLYKCEQAHAMWHVEVKGQLERLGSPLSYEFLGLNLAVGSTGTH